MLKWQAAMTKQEREAWRAKVGRASKRAWQRRAETQSTNGNGHSYGGGQHDSSALGCA